MEKLYTKYFSRHELRLPVNHTGKQADVRVVIPVLLEEEYIWRTLHSLAKSARESGLRCEVIVVVNYSIKATDEVKQRQHDLFEALLQRAAEFQPELSILVQQVYDMPRKHAGAGLARKFGMDYAAWMFANEANTRGAIVSLDADCDVDESYFTDIYNLFANHTDVDGCTIHFEHRTEDTEPQHAEAMWQYELHLRYYKQALYKAGFPYYYYTIGSGFAVTTELYVRAGGMSRNHAGEDFYFLQKTMPLGYFHELVSSAVYPSSRLSGRVPFGTGPALIELLDAGGDYLTYNLQAFMDLKALLDMHDEFYKIDYSEYEKKIGELSGRMRAYLVHSDFFKEICQVSENCATKQAFSKRFYEVFNAFRVVKYLNYVHVHFLEKTPVFDAASDCLDWLGIEDVPFFGSTKELLDYYAVLDGRGVKS